MFQQLSIKAAGTIFGRLTTLCGGEALYTPHTLLAQSVDDLRAVGLSGRKVEYIQGIAAAFNSGQLNPTEWDELEDWRLMEQLVALRGLGASVFPLEFSPATRRHSTVGGACIWC